MKDIISRFSKIIRISSKEWFINLRERSPIYCASINEEFFVSNLFLRHISGNANKRDMIEITERLSIINLVQKISKEWILVEVRENIKIEWYDYKKSYKIKWTEKWIDFFIILAKRLNDQNVLISIFLNFLK